MANTRAALSSIWAPVCLSPLRGDSAEAARLLATCDELLLCSVSDASRPIREDACFVFLDIAVPFTSGFGDGPEWHHLIALGWLVINLLLGCFQSRKLHDIGFALEVAFRQSGECFHVRSEERRVGKECVSTCRSRWSPYH